MIEKNSLTLYEASKARHKQSPVLQILIWLAVLVVSGIVIGIVTGIPMGIYTVSNMDIGALVSDGMTPEKVTQYTQSLMSSMPEWFSVVGLFATVITTVCACVYVLKLEGRSWASMGFKKKGFLGNYLRGMAIGAGMIFACAALAVASGSASFTGLNENVAWGMIALFFLGFLVQGMSEEVLMRGYLMVSLTNRVKVAVAVGLTSVLFAVLHLANSGLSLLAFINITLFGVFAGVYMLRTDDLWGVCAIHSLWNFVQGNVLGVSVSGGAVSSSVFGTVFVQGKELLNGGSFGLEGGLCTTIVLALGIALTLFIPMKERPQLPSIEEQPEISHDEPMPVYIQK